MMSDREQLLATAVTVGLVLGVDFGKNISNANLQKKIDDKKAEIEGQLKGNLNDITPPKSQSDNEILDSILKGLESGNLKEEGLVDNTIILRVSSCGNYKVKIKGYAEAARRSGVTVAQIKDYIDSSKPVGGYTFTFVG